MLFSPNQHSRFCHKRAEISDLIAENTIKGLAMKTKKFDLELKIEKLEEILEEKLENFEGKVAIKLAKIKKKIDKRLKKLKSDSVNK